MNQIKPNYVLYFDNFNYHNLIKKIDSGYRLMFDNIKKIFIIINIANNNEICLKFNSFSFDLIKTLQKTRIENAKEIFNEIDKYNEKLENNKICDIKNKTTSSAKDLIKFSKRTSNIKSTDINKIIEGKNA